MTKYFVTSCTYKIRFVRDILNGTKESLELLFLLNIEQIVDR